ncbi:glycosylphosphatidylinositol anchor attachment 1 protein-like [Lytechinus pictus]|uniref:glycosylphosphatidylinositol anchor attachment 1 protein-like n=1 Tax=Lytechinus pictus TaxID=7653 RepID=UPI0030B9AD61
MGLLTDTRTQAVLSRIILAVHKPLEVILYIAGVASLLALAFTPLNDKTYFSENALLPGLVERKYLIDHSIKDYAKELTRLGAVDNGKGPIPEEWVKAQFMDLGLDVYSQNFTVQHPFITKTNGTRGTGGVTGTNVYAILRAPRIAGTEAIVITVPYRNKEAEAGRSRTHHGIGLMLSLASFFSKNTFWSKDIVFVVVDKEEVGMQAWLSGYHDIPSEYLQISLMLGRSGSIIAAINLELGSEFTDHIDLKIEGLNGQLPNLDLFNLAVRLCRLERVPVTFQNRADPPERLVLKWAGLKHSATTMLLNMAKQASGKPSGIHGLFVRYHIEALTLQAHPAKRGLGVEAVGRVMEGVVRSVNNLLERFHQSFFFYVLPSCERYVSIGLYMIPFGLLLVVPTLRAMALWLLAVQPIEQITTSDEKDQDEKEDIDKKAKEQEGRPFGQVMPLIIGAHIMGAILFVSPQYLVSEHIKAFNVSPQGAIAIGFAAFFVGSSSLPIFGRRSNFQTNEQLPSDWQLLKCLTLIWYTVTLLAVSMFNFSLAFFVAVPTIPIVVLVRPVERVILKMIQGFLLLLISPLSLIYSFITLNHGYFHSRDAMIDILNQGFYKTVESFFEGVVNAYLFGNKTFALITLVWFPIWFLFWVVLFRKASSSTISK